jgi:hypothetical protein
MQHQTPAMSPSWGGRVRALLSRLFHLTRRDAPALAVRGEMQPIDFEGEDTSLTERDLKIMK